LIKKVKNDDEVRKIGKQSSARRAMEKTEYKSMMRILEHANDADLGAK
jgi:hypothetical protein